MTWSKSQPYPYQMWNHPDPDPGHAARTVEEPPPVSLSMPEEDANSVSSHDDGSSADETTPAVASSSQNGSTGASGKKRKRTKYQKTSYVVLLSLPSLPCLTSPHLLFLSTLPSLAVLIIAYPIMPKSCHRSCHRRLPKMGECDNSSRRIRPATLTLPDASSARRARSSVTAPSQHAHGARGITGRASI